MKTQTTGMRHHLSSLILPATLLVALIPLQLFIFTPEDNRIDACKLLSPANLEKVQGSKPVSTHGNFADDGSLARSQCFFALSPSSQSVSLYVMFQSARDRRDVREFWRETFHATPTAQIKHDEAGHGGRGEEQERHNPPRLVSGIGEETFWVYTGRDGAIYTLQGNYILRLGVGGAADESTKIKNASELVRFALQNIPRAQDRD